jgi:hypothetical protein
MSYQISKCVIVALYQKPKKFDNTGKNMED